MSSLPQVDQRILFRELSEGDVERTSVGTPARNDHRLQGRGGEVMCVRGHPRRTDRVADPDVAEPPELPDLSGGERRPLYGGAALEHTDRGHLPLVAFTEPQPIPRPDRPGEQASERDLLSGRPALDLEYGARHGAVVGTFGRGKQLRDACGQRVHAGTGDGRAEEHRMYQRTSGLCRQLVAEPRVRHGRRTVDDRCQQRVVVFGEQLRELGREHRVRRAVWPERGALRARALLPPHRDDGRCELLGDRPEHTVASRSAAVDLVHEQQGRDAQPLQRPHQDAGLRLHALDGRDHQHGAVEHVQHPFHLGDEIRVTGRVDQVDRDVVVDDERHHGGLDRDATLAFQRQGVGLGVAIIDAADLVDDAGGVEQPLGEAGLTGVYMRQDPQVERSHRASCPSRRWRSLPAWTLTLGSSHAPWSI